MSFTDLKIITYMGVTTTKSIYLNSRKSWHQLRTMRASLLCSTHLDCFIICIRHWFWLEIRLQVAIQQSIDKALQILHTVHQNQNPITCYSMNSINSKTIKRPLIISHTSRTLNFIAPGVGLLVGVLHGHECSQLVRDDSSISLSIRC